MAFYPLSALLSRMKYIPRWGLMRSSRSENLCEHAADSAFIAHMLCCISNKIFSTNVRSSEVTVMALYHDASEILTGDLPTPVKYKNETLKSAFKALEAQSADSLSRLVPTELQDTMNDYLMQTSLVDKEKSLLKAADRLSALIKCIDEEHSGNHEFASAKAQQLAAIKNMHCQEAEYFIENMLPCFNYTLDELSASGPI